MTDQSQKSNIEIFRHSLAHLMAEAVLDLYPDAKLGIGPVIENGFYYDFSFTEAAKLSPEDLPKIEKKIRGLIHRDVKFEREIISAEKAKEIFQDQPFKLELIGELEEKGEEISMYKSGNFTDLCKGPHVESAKEINPDAFKLTKIAGAYWKGSEKNPMLTRIYGLAFDTKKELDDYLALLEEAKKRDHRVLGEKMDLFMISEEVGKGLPLWLPNGAFIRKKLEDYMYEKELKCGYSYVYTPVLTHKKLYETSGHLAHYKDDMYNPIDIEGEEYYLKPMNCPHHHVIFKHKPKSYRDLPLRLADFGLLHRFERSGVLSGLIRARCFSQNDAHIYCQKSRLKEELTGVLKLFKEVYDDFSIKDFWYRLSLPDLEDKEKYGDIENKEIWEKSAQEAREAMEEFGVKYVEEKGEATFYGPKIDVQVKNVLGKEDTIATVQIDFYAPERFDLTFINEKGEKERPVIIHRAIMGSFDRFFAFLTEQTGGAFPIWLAPVQAWILPIGEGHREYAEEIFERSKEKGIRVELRDENETLGKKIREGKMQKIPYLLVIGDKEVESETITVESRDEGKIGVLTIDKFIDRFKS